MAIEDFPIEKPHVFISYVRENQKEVDRLCSALRKNNIEVWIDREKIRPGTFWEDAIRSAIREGAFFIAFFSKEFNEKNKNYMNQELNLAIEEIQRRPRDRAWFIPVLLSGKVPDWQILPGKTFRDIQWVALYENWEVGINNILNVISPHITAENILNQRLIKKLFTALKLQDSEFEFELDTIEEGAPLRVIFSIRPKTDFDESRLNIIKTEYETRLKVLEIERENLEKIVLKVLETPKAFVQKIEMGDKYKISGNVDIIGPNSQVHEISFNQLLDKSFSDINLKVLASDLSRLRTILEKKSETPDQYRAVGEIAAAEVASKEGDARKIFEHLKKAGKRALDVATDIGTDVAAEVIKKSLGL
jgi:hypothetical protein